MPKPSRRTLLEFLGGAISEVGVFLLWKVLNLMPSWAAVVAFVALIIVWAVVYLKYKPTTPPREPHLIKMEKDGLSYYGEFARNYADETDRINKLNLHKDNVRNVYAKWAVSSLSQSRHTFPEPFVYGKVSLSDVYVDGLPDKEPEYDEARVDLQCWPEAHKKLEDAESALKTLNAEMEKTRAKALQAIRRVMERYGLQDRGGGVSSEPKWSNDQEILGLLMLRRINDADRYVKPIIELQNGKWICVLDSSSKQSEGGLVWGVDSPDEVKALVELFENFGANMDGVMKKSDYYNGLCDEIKSTQSHFRTVSKDYGEFTNALSEPIKHLRYSYPPDGGMCNVCLGLRA